MIIIPKIFATENYDEPDEITHAEKFEKFVLDEPSQDKNDYPVLVYQFDDLSVWKREPATALATGVAVVSGINDLVTLFKTATAISTNYKEHVKQSGSMAMTLKDAYSLFSSTDKEFIDAKQAFKTYIDEQTNTISKQLSDGMEAAEVSNFNMIIKLPLQNIEIYFQNCLDAIPHSKTPLSETCKSATESPDRIINDVINYIYSEPVKNQIKCNNYSDKSYDEIVNSSESALKLLVFYYCVCQINFGEESVTTESLQTVVNHRIELFKKKAGELNDYRKVRQN